MTSILLQKATSLTIIPKLLLGKILVQSMVLHLHRLLSMANHQHLEDSSHNNLTMAVSVDHTLVVVDTHPLHLNKVLRMVTRLSNPVTVLLLLLSLKVLIPVNLVKLHLSNNNNNNKSMACLLVPRLLLVSPPLVLPVS